MTNYAIMEKLDEIRNLMKSKVSDRWLNMSEICEYTGLSQSTIRRNVRKGILKTSNTTGKLLFRISSIDRWLNG